MTIDILMKFLAYSAMITFLLSVGWYLLDNFVNAGKDD